ncbi:hypothetical protein M0802_014598 [Mischocyttarus mexicanus]|nr:hypothetical protein M0802_014598 [Mischocyttarus mexicanus]
MAQTFRSRHVSKYERYIQILERKTHRIAIIDEIFCAKGKERPDEIPNRRSIKYKGHDFQTSSQPSGERPLRADAIYTPTKGNSPLCNRVNQRWFTRLHKVGSGEAA